MLRSELLFTLVPPEILAYPVLGGERRGRDCPELIRGLAKKAREEGEGKRLKGRDREAASAFSRRQKERGEFPLGRACVGQRDACLTGMLRVARTYDFFVDPARKDQEVCRRDARNRSALDNTIPS